jgi:hypothetical protein
VTSRSSRCGYYSYWSDLPTDTFEAYSRPGRGWAVCPTNDGLTLVIGGWPYAGLAAHRNDVEATLMATFASSPAFTERIRAAKRAERMVGGSVSNRDFITAQGITDAFLDAEGCARALGAALAGSTPYAEAMAGYQSGRDARAIPAYQLTLQIAGLQPPDQQMIELLSAIAGDQAGMDAFAQLNSGVTAPAEFFAPEKVQYFMRMR